MKMNKGGDLGDMYVFLCRSNVFSCLFDVWWGFRSVYTVIRIVSAVRVLHVRIACLRQILVIYMCSEYSSVPNITVYTGGLREILVVYMCSFVRIRCLRQILVIQRKRGGGRKREGECDRETGMRGGWEGGGAGSQL